MKAVEVVFDGQKMKLVDRHEPIEELPLWYRQFMELDESKKKKAIARILEGIKQNRKKLYDFIKKSECELVGVVPRIVYMLPGGKDEESSTTWIHAFAMTTLLFWHEEGQFGFFANPVLSYNDSILNHEEGNKTHDLKGFTG